MSKSDSAAEAFLLEQGIIQQPSSHRRAVLGCIACRWNASEVENREPKFHGYQALQCRDFASGTLYPILRPLVDGGVLEVHDAVATQPKLGTPVRKEYSPVDSDLGNGFRAALEVPVQCQLGEQALSLAHLPTDQLS